MHKIMGTIANLLDKYLRALYDVSDPIYKSLVSDVEGIPEPIISNPIDYKIGAIASVFEWQRQLALSLLKQLFLTEAEGKFLDLMIHEHIGLMRFENEDDAVYSARVQDYIISQKVSRAAIIYYTRPYSDPGEPEILDGADDAAFADITHSDVYTEFRNEQVGAFYHWWVFPAITASIGATAYFFVLRLENTNSADIAKVIDLLDRWVAGGIAYELQIVAV